LESFAGDVTAGLDREWLVTNGLGGYAAGSILGATTRGYHGLLVAALRPPVDRFVLVTKVDEEITLPDGQVLQLGVNEYEDGTINPQGQSYLTSFALEGDIPCFTYQLTPDLRLEKRVWMEYGENITYVQYLLRDTSGQEPDEKPLQLTILPFCLYRDHHTITRGRIGWRFLVDSLGEWLRGPRQYWSAPISPVAEPGGCVYSNRALVLERAPSSRPGARFEQR
jgi:predicted glycogen debranching enzyme